MISNRITCAFLYTITRHGYPPAAEETVRYIDEMAALGFSSVELEGIGREHIDGVARLRGPIRRALEANGLSLPVFCTVLPRLGSIDARQRSEALEAFRRGCDAAAFLGAGGVLDNGPLVPYAFPADLPVSRHYAPELLQRIGLPEGFDWARYCEQLVEALQRVCDTAAGFGLKYYLHPCCGSLTETTDGYVWLRQAVGRTNLRFNFDVSNQFYMRENLTLGLEKLAGELDYIHLSDNRGTRVEHLAVGDGAIDWEQLFATLSHIGFDGHLAIDVGGAESGIDDLDDAYLRSARRIEQGIATHRLFEQRT